MAGDICSTNFLFTYDPPNNGYGCNCRDCQPTYHFTKNNQWEIDLLNDRIAKLEEELRIENVVSRRAVELVRDVMRSKTDG